MEIVPFSPHYAPQAAALFTERLAALRSQVAALPGEMTRLEHVSAELERFFTRHPGLAALHGGQLLGYLGWIVVPNFRGAGYTAAYVAEWWHAAQDDGKLPIYQALYRAASAEWAAAGCRAHAITLLANDPLAERAWFRQGFGMLVIDAIRLLTPLEALPAAGLTIRKAGAADAAALAALDAVHFAHYSQPPVFMAARAGLDAAGNQEFLAKPGNAVWLGCDGERLAGFLRFDANEYEGASITNGAGVVGITGAFVLPEYRGYRLAPALLAAALADYAAQGYRACAVDFESFNPEAANFWVKFFQPVCHSLLRMPESPGF